MAYFVTGATGFIGKRLVKKLLERKGSTVYFLVRAASAAKLRALYEYWGVDKDRAVAVNGDITEAYLGLSSADRKRLDGEVDHFFHLAAIYDLKAKDEENEAANVGGTKHAVQLANDLGAKCFHHVSSIAAAGMYEGVFREDMFDEAADYLDHPYYRTKHDSEKAVRGHCKGAWRIYRPGIDGYRIIDSMVVTATGAERLSHYLAEHGPDDRVIPI